MEQADTDRNSPAILYHLHGKCVVHGGVLGGLRRRAPAVGKPYYGTDSSMTCDWLRVSKQLTSFSAPPDSSGGLEREKATCEEIPRLAKKVLVLEYVKVCLSPDAV